MTIVDHEGRIVLVNRQTKLISGFAHEELLGRPVSRLMPERVRREQSERYSQYFTDPAFRQATPGLESLRRRKDGGEYPVEVSRSPIQTARGVLVCSAARDITQRKRAEMALQHSEASYRSLTQGATCGIFRCRVDGKFLTVNPALVAMLGYGSASDG